jgi:WD40 repeat protein
MIKFENEYLIKEILSSLKAYTIKYLYTDIKNKYISYFFLKFLKRIEEIIDTLGVNYVIIEGHHSEVTSLAQLANQNIVSISSDNNIIVWNCVTLSITSICEEKALLPMARNSNFTSILNIPKTNKLLIIDNNSNFPSIIIWKGFKFKNLFYLNDYKEFFKQKILSQLLLPKQKLALGLSNGIILIWKRKKRTFSQYLKAHDGEVNCLLNLDNNMFASGSADFTINLWKLGVNGKYIFNKIFIGFEFYSILNFNSQDFILAGDNRITIFDKVAMVKKKTIKCPDGKITCLVLFAYGYFASGSADGTIKIWNDSYECERMLFYQSQIKSLLVLKDGRIVSGSSDKTIRVWNY